MGSRRRKKVTLMGAEREIEGRGKSIQEKVQDKVSCGTKVGRPVRVT